MRSGSSLDLALEPFEPAFQCRRSASRSRRSLRRGHRSVSWFGSNSASAALAIRDALVFEQGGQRSALPPRRAWQARFVAFARRSAAIRSNVGTRSAMSLPTRA